MTAHREPAGEPVPVPARAGRSRFWWVKYLLGAAVAGLLVAEGLYIYPRLHESWQSLTELHWGWAAACVLMQAISMSGFARIQKQLMNAGGVQVTQRRSLSVVYGATAMSVTLPAGPMFSTAFTYRQTRRWGASPIVASWQLVFSGVIGAAGMVLLGLGGAALVGDRVGPWKVVLSLGALVLVVVAGNYASGNPGSLRALLRRILRLINRIRRHPPEDGMDRIEEILHQLESVDLHRRDGALVTVWALMHRLGDVACLGAACYAVGAQPRVAALMIVFSMGKAVGSIPFAPGGIVYVDAMLIYSLTAIAGLPTAQAVAAAGVYRLVSFIMVAIVGWVVFAFLFRGTQAGDAEYEKEFEERSLLTDQRTRGENRPAAGTDSGDEPPPPAE